MVKSLALIQISSYPFSSDLISHPNISDTDVSNLSHFFQEILTIALNRVKCISTVFRSIYVCLIYLQNK